MRKIRLTKKSLNTDYWNILGTGYCNLQFLLKFQEPFAYSTRAEGWACDYYNVDGVLISTGYSPLKSKRVRSCYELEHEYNDIARKILEDSEISWKEKEQRINKLLRQFVERIRRRHRNEQQR